MKSRLTIVARRWCRARGRAARGTRLQALRGQGIAVDEPPEQGTARMCRAPRGSNAHFSRPVHRALSTLRSLAAATPSSVRYFGCHTMSYARGEDRILKMLHSSCHSDASKVTGFLAARILLGHFVKGPLQIAGITARMAVLRLRHRQNAENVAFDGFCCIAMLEPCGDWGAQW